ncbi:MAG: HAMP domain-containing histidine kinase, partial [Bacteroidia bacterium]|nr:HAMP domain-containing histidine kinase [Bacteroidia bacterium]
LLVAGLTTFQLYWIHHAFKVKDHHFTQSVNTSLNQVVESIERGECVSAITSCLNYPARKPLQFHKHLDSSTVFHNSIKSHILALKDTNTDLYYQIYVKKQRDRLGNSYKCICIKNPKSCRLHCGFATMKKRGKIKTLGQRIKQLMKGKTNIVENIVGELLKFEVDIDINDRINPKVIDSLIAQKLQQNGIDLDYDYGIYEEDSEKFIYQDSLSDAATLKNSKFAARLFPNDMFLSPNYLTLHFPDQKQYIIREMSAILGSSLALILGIILCFSYAVKTILQQKRLSEMKNDFINNMTHEFKTPISTISLASEVLKDPEIIKDKDRLERLSNVIYDENKRLSGQTEKILQMAVLEKENQQLNLEDVDLHELIANSINCTKLQIEEKNGSITSMLEAKNFIIQADKTHIMNVLRNLLDNAIKYTKVNPNITISSKNVSNGVLLSVEDNGIGISKENQKNIFDKFYRVPTGNVHDVKGFGLGLSYVVNIIKAHKGEITVESKLDKGSKFKLFFPFQIT